MDELIKKLRAFMEERNWAQFHTPENLAKSIVIEAAELLELYQWTKDTDNIQAVKEELADVFIYCLLFADRQGLDIDSIITEKIEKNKKKYPVSKAYGNAKKYTQFDEEE